MLWSSLKKLIIKINNSIRLKLITMFIVIVIILSSFIIVTYFIDSALINKLDGMINVVIDANSVIEEVKNITVSRKENEDKCYLDRLTDAVFDSSDGDIEKAKVLIQHGMEDINTLLDRLNKSSIKDEKGGHIIQKTNNFYNSFKRVIENELYSVDNTDIRNIIKSKDEAIKLGGFFVNSIQELISNELIYSSVQKGYLNKQMVQTGTTLVIVIALATWVSIIVSLVFTNQIGGSIRKLALFSEKISEGNFDIKDLSPVGHDELSVLTSAINIMKNNIGKLIEQIKEKADIENKLKEKELENLKIFSELNLTKYKSLQSQINPHFLFNTLNSISRVAYFKQAPEIVKLIEALSDMIRYNLTKIEQPVTLAQEIASLENYIYIQKVRFGDKMEFHLDINSNLLETLMPCLTLQPIIENAIIHGLEPYDYNGMISVKVHDEEDQYVVIKIEDNGIGMNTESLEKLFDDGMANNKSSHSTGIGLNNVITRLNYFFKNKNIIDFKSELGKGTSISLKLPVNLLEGRHV